MPTQPNTRTAASDGSAGAGPTLPPAPAPENQHGAHWATPWIKREIEKAKQHGKH